MRLIDADELIKAMSEHGRSETEVINCFWYDENIIALICNAPTVTKSLQGEWITHKVAFHLTCSFCGCNLRAIKREVFEGDYDYNFCPNCGAKMMR